MTRRLVNKLLHRPVQTLRKSEGMHAGGTYLHAMEKLFHLEPAEAAGRALPTQRPVRAETRRRAATGRKSADHHPAAGPCDDVMASRALDYRTKPRRRNRPPPAWWRAGAPSRSSARWPFWRSSSGTPAGPRGVVIYRLLIDGLLLLAWLLSATGLGACLLRPLLRRGAAGRRGPGTWSPALRRALAFQPLRARAGARGAARPGDGVRPAPAGSGAGRAGVAGSPPRASAPARIGRPVRRANRRGAWSWLWLLAVPVRGGRGGRRDGAAGAAVEAGRAARLRRRGVPPPGAAGVVRGGADRPAEAQRVLVHAAGGGDALPAGDAPPRGGRGRGCTWRSSCTRRWWRCRWRPSRGSRWRWTSERRAGRRSRAWPRRPCRGWRSSARSRSTRAGLLLYGTLAAGLGSRRDLLPRPAPRAVAVRARPARWPGFACGTKLTAVPVILIGRAGGRRWRHVGRHALPQSTGGRCRRLRRRRRAGLSGDVFARRRVPARRPAAVLPVAHPQSRLDRQPRLPRRHGRLRQGPLQRRAGRAVEARPRPRARPARRRRPRRAAW